jgi:hypothetical protein
MAACQTYLGVRFKDDRQSYREADRRSYRGGDRRFYREADRRSYRDDDCSDSSRANHNRAIGSRAIDRERLSQILLLAPGNSSFARSSPKGRRMRSRPQFRT